MSIKRTILLMSLLAIVILGPLFLISLLLSENEAELSRSQEIHSAAVVLARELGESSDLLTRAARDYVMTGDPNFEAMYQHTVDVRNGKAARPDGRTVPFRSLLNRLQLTPEEESKLSTAEDNSDDLAKTETIAMNAVKGLFDDGSGAFIRRGEPDLELARRLMFGKVYQERKDLIMDPIGEFFQMTQERTKGAVRSYQARGHTLLQVQMALAFCLIVLLLVFFLHLSKRIIRPVLTGGLTAAEVASGNLTAVWRVEQSDEIGEFGKAFNSMVAELRAKEEERGRVEEELKDFAQQTETRSEELKRLTEASEARIAEESSLAALTSRLQGKLSVEEVAERALAAIAEFTAAPVGSLYGSRPSFS